MLGERASGRHSPRAGATGCSRGRRGGMIVGRRSVRPRRGVPVIYRLLPLILTFVAGRLKKSQKAKRATQNAARSNSRSRKRR